MKKRILSLILAIVMVAGMLPTTAFAAAETIGGEENTPIVIGANDIRDGNTYTYTAERDGTLYVTVTELYYGEYGIVTAGNLNNWVAVTINGTAITKFANTVEVSAGDTVTVAVESLDSDTYHGTVNLSWEAPVFAEITGVSITVDNVPYTEGEVIITPDTQSIIFTVTGTNFANVSDQNFVFYAVGVNDLLNRGWTIDTESNTATKDFSGYISTFEGCNNFEVEYSNNGQLSWTGTGIYLTYVKPAPDSTGKIVVDMKDHYSDGWNGAAIEVYKDDILETTATVDTKSNTVSLDYDSAASYEFKWVKGKFDNECSFTIYADGEAKLEVSNATAYADGETILTLEATAKELAITKQPTDAEAKLGENYCVEVIAQGEGLTYQWYFKNEGSSAWHKSSVTDNTYDDVMTTARAGREVYCVITDASGNSVTTDTATLIAVKTAELAITKQPNDDSAKLGEMFNVEVLAEGDGLKYQWYWRQIGSEKWNVSGQRDNTYDDVMTSARHNREVYCVITDAWGDSVTTEIATITGTPTVTLAITRQPESQTVTLGDMFNVTFDAVGDGLKYQWYFKNSGTDVWHTSAQKDNSYDDVMTKARHDRSLYCVVTDIWGNSVTTETVTLVCTDIPQAIAMN